MRSRIISYLQSKLSPSLSSNKPILSLFLRGIKQRLQLSYPKPYNYYINIFSFVLTFAFAKYLYSYKTNQMDLMGYNWFVFDYVYKVREQSHVYWEIARLAKGLPTTYTYYQWDENLMYEITRTGTHLPFHSHKGLQNPSTFTSPLHQYNFPASAQKHAKIIMYLKHLKNPYDLKNYLRYKPVNIGDYLRAVNYFVYRQLGFTNRWRYDEYVAKPDIVYQFEKIKYNYALEKDRKKLYQNIRKIIKRFKENSITYLFWLNKQ